LTSQRGVSPRITQEMTGVELNQFLATRQTQGSMDLSTANEIISDWESHNNNRDTQRNHTQLYENAIAYDTARANREAEPFMIYFREFIADKQFEGITREGAEQIVLLLKDEYPQYGDRMRTWVDSLAWDDLQWENNNIGREAFPNFSGLNFDAGTTTSETPMLNPSASGGTTTSSSGIANMPSSFSSLPVGTSSQDIVNAMSSAQILHESGGINTGDNAAGASGVAQFTSDTWDAVLSRHPELSAQGITTNSPQSHTPDQQMLMYNTLMNELVSKYLSKGYDAQSAGIFALVAYNAGEGRVDDFLLNDVSYNPEQFEKTGYGFMRWMEQASTRQLAEHQGLLEHPRGTWGTTQIVGSDAYWAHESSPYVNRILTSMGVEGYDVTGAASGTATASGGIGTEATSVAELDWLDEHPEWSIGAGNLPSASSISSVWGSGGRFGRSSSHDMDVAMNTANEQAMEAKTRAQETRTIGEQALLLLTRIAEATGSQAEETEKIAWNSSQAHTKNHIMTIIEGSA
jgi:hypothetical protein